VFLWSRRWTVLVVGGWGCFVYWGGYANVENVCTKQVSNTVGRGCRKFCVRVSKYWQTDSCAALCRQNSWDLSCVFLLRPAFSNFFFVGENVFTRDLICYDAKYITHVNGCGFPGIHTTYNRSSHEVWRKTTENGIALTLVHAVAPPTLHKQREAHKLFKIM